MVANYRMQLSMKRTGVGGDMAPLRRILPRLVLILCPLCHPVL
jgi:hypothetical protein